MSEIGGRIYRYLKNQEFYGLYDISLKFEIEGATRTHVVELESGFEMKKRVRWDRENQAYKVKAEKIDSAGDRVMLRVPFRFAERSDDVRNIMARHPHDKKWYPVTDYWFDGLEVVLT